MPAKGHDDARPPEKHQHLQHLNEALSDALHNWNPADGSEVVIRFEATITPNPGGVSQYRVVLAPDNN